MLREKRKHLKRIKTLKMVGGVAVLITSLCLCIGLIIMLFLGKDKQPAGTMGIETPYCTLYYPEEWEEYLEYEINEDLVYTITFTANIDGKEAKLFKLSFGDSGNLVIGKIHTDSKGDINVGLEVYTLEETLEWPENAKNIVYQMRDAADELVGHLKNDSDFIENK